MEAANRRSLEAFPQATSSSLAPKASSRSLAVSVKGQEQNTPLVNLIREIEAHIFSEGASDRSVAQQILSVLKEMIFRETGIAGIEEGLSSYMRKLWADPSVGRLITQLSDSARAILSPLLKGASARGFVRERVLSDLDELLNWYLRRQLSFREIAHAGLDLEEEEGIFGFEIAHDTEAFGVRGLEVSCGLRLIGRAEQSLWFKVFVRHHGELIAPRRSWRFWIDDSQFFGLDSLEQEGKLCSIVPLNPAGQRVIVDRVKAFLPYEALSLPAGRTEIELDAGVYDEKGKRILACHGIDTISVSAGDFNSRPVPSPQALGMWPSDAVSRDEISNLQVRSTPARSIDLGHSVIASRFDLSLFGHEGEKIQVECRFMTREGDLIESRSGAHVDMDGAFVQSIDLRPQSAVVRLRGIEIVTPVRCLELDPGIHQLLCEMSVLLPSRRVLCGTVQKIDLIAPEIGSATHQFFPPQPLLHHEEGLELSHLSVEVDEWFEGRESIRSVLYFRSPNLLKQAYRVFVGIEPATREGHAPGAGSVVRTFLIGGHGGTDAEKLIVRFLPSEIAALRGGQPADSKSIPVSIDARVFVDVYSLEGGLLISTSRDLHCPTPIEDTLVIGSSRERVEASVEDVEILLGRQPREIHCDFICNLLLSPIHEGRFTLYYEFVNGDGRTIGVPPLGADTDLPGVIREINFASILDEKRGLEGVYQLRFPIDITLPLELQSSAFTTALLKTMIFAPSGRLLQALTIPLARCQRISRGRVEFPLFEGGESPLPSRVEKKEVRTSKRGFLDRVFALSGR